MSAVSKVVVFGSTGQTGLCTIDAALKKGKIYKKFVYVAEFNYFFVVEEMRLVCYITCHLAIDSFTAN
jgi:hypothetical protein